MEKQEYKDQFYDLIGKAVENLDDKEFQEMLTEIRDTIDAARKPPIENLSFGDAIEYAKMGHRIQRAGWNGKGQYVELAVGLSYVSPAGEVVNAQHKAIGNAALAFVGTSGVQIGWLASQADMLADDWRLADVDREEGEKQPEQQHPVWSCPFCKSAYVDDMTNISCRKGLQVIDRRECRGFKEREEKPSGGV